MERNYLIIYYGLENKGGTIHGSVDVTLKESDKLNLDMIRKIESGIQERNNLKQVIILNIILLED